MKQLITLFAVAATVSVMAESPGIPYNRKINIYRTDTPPVLDGKMDDPCWQQAEVAGDFRRLFKKSEAAHPNTEARVCYDARYLYFYYKMYDDKIDKLQVGMPDDARDIMDVNKDVIELFLDPKRSGKAYFQFMTSPLGARFDLRVTPAGKREIGLFTPDWQVTPFIGQKYWAVEFRIPFNELVFDGGAIGTPVPGEEWGINFCRDQGYRKEWSFWSPHKDKSFHRPAQFGTAVFRGFRTAPPLPSIQWSGKSTLGFGPDTLELTAKPLTQVKTVWKILHDRKTINKTVKNNLQPYKYHIIEGGEWDIRVDVSRNDQLLFCGRTKVLLPEVTQFINTINRELNAAIKKLAAGLSNQVESTLKPRILEMKTLVSPLAGKLANAKALDHRQWQQLTTLLPAIKTKWASLQYAVKMLNLYPTGEKQKKFAVASAGPAQRIYRDTIIPPDNKPVELWGAGGESESFQLLLMPFWCDSRDVKVAFTGLKGAKGSIPAGSLEYNMVDFVKLPEAWGGKWVPDVLNPNGKINLTRDRTQPIWINVHIPRGTAKGDYRGTVKISADGQTSQIALVVHAFGFDIPVRRSVATDPWYWPDGRSYRKYYKLKKIPFTPELYEKQLKTLAKYRYGCYPLDTLPMWSLLKIYQEKDGSLTFDFSGWDWVFALGKKYGADNLGASFGCNFNSMRPTFSGRIPILDRKTGKKVSTPGQYAWKTAKWKYTRGKTAKSDFAANPVYRQYISQLVAYLRKKGLLNSSHYEIYDEPKTGAEWQDVLKMHGFLKKFVPDLKLKSYGVAPWNYEHRPELRPFGYYDVWAPGLYTLTPQHLKQLHERRKKGEEFWFYTCSAGYRDSDRKSRPHICLYQHPLAPRIHGWAAWKLQADGFLIFALMAGYPENVQKDPAKYYSEPIWHAGRTAAQGYLVYPGPEQSLRPSIRLAAVRDGLEDYEYFKVLQDRLKTLDPDKDAALIKAIKAELEIGDDILPWDWHEWTRDIAKLQNKRKRLAGLISAAGNTDKGQK